MLMKGVCLQVGCFDLQLPLNYFFFKRKIKYSKLKTKNIIFTTPANGGAPSGQS